MVRSLEQPRRAQEEESVWLRPKAHNGGSVHDAWTIGMTAGKGMRS